MGSVHWSECSGQYLLTSECAVCNKQCAVCSVQCTVYCLYINLACLSVCLSVCLYPINVKTAEPIRPKFFVGHHVTTGKVYE